MDSPEWKSSWIFDSGGRQQMLAIGRALVGRPKNVIPLKVKPAQDSLRYLLSDAMQQIQSPP